MVEKIGAMYQVVPEDLEQLQQYLNNYQGQNPTAGESDQLYQ
ncbi:hypothetical protein [Bacillus thermotolerans]|mgnify:CR=1 FL=1|uniref:Uncharacterized protein n=1 Tax=Bacillus thermotolerans TaxID=1221996 RepID=A0A0F5HSP9_BACTR|nr:hypothetical protein [Bacillus thermotolerans]KKB36331.1 hypothetical protein QY95_03195 [Bacillus thermotolerans]